MVLSRELWIASISAVAIDTRVGGLQNGPSVAVNVVALELVMVHGGFLEPTSGGPQPRLGYTNYR
jgi:hypothetical protein